ncbi:MAG: hypothetical protein AB7L13_06115 [Acidimicrobiia bacterium]
MNAAAEWTDQNTHDPGITTLEVLAYSIAATALTVVVVRRRAKKRRLGES